MASLVLKMTVGALLLAVETGGKKPKKPELLRLIEMSLSDFTFCLFF